MVQETPPQDGRTALSFAVAGAAGGAAFYFAVGLGLCYLLWGPNGALLPEGDAPALGYWIGHVMSSWINLFSFMAFGTAIALLIARAKLLRREQSGFSLDLLGVDDDTLLLPKDALEIHRRIGHLDERTSSLQLVRFLHAGLQRARANWSAEDVGEAIKTQAELLQGKTEAEYSTVRYLAWAIPSIGFIGTVLGIGQAMGSLQGDKGADVMTVAAGHLSVAFDTTFVALVLSLILMYVLHRVQASDDMFQVRAVDWCMRRFVHRMHISTGPSP